MSLPGPWSDLKRAAPAPSKVALLPTKVSPTIDHPAICPLVAVILPVNCASEAVI